MDIFYYFKPVVQISVSFESHMRYITLFLFCVIRWCSSVQAQCGTSEQKLFTSPGTTFGGQVAAFAKDGSLITAGLAFQPSMRTAVTWMDASNNTIKQLKTYEDFQVLRMAVADNDDVVMIGRKVSLNSQVTMFMLRINAAGNVLWIKRIYDAHQVPGRTVESIRPTDMMCTAAGDIVVVGTKYNVNTAGSGYFTAFILKTDGSGNLMWGKEHDQAGTGEYYAVVEKNNAYYAGGIGGGPDAGALLSKIDPANGNIITQTGYVLSTVRANYIRNMYATSYGFLLTMSAWSSAAAKTGYYILKLDHNGNVIADKQLVFTDLSVLNPYYDIMPTPDGGCMVWFNDADNVLRSYEAKLYKLDQQLNPQWKKYYPVPGANSNASIISAWAQGTSFKAIGASCDPAIASATQYMRLFNIASNGNLVGCVSQDAVLNIKDSLHYTIGTLWAPTIYDMQFVAPFTATTTATAITPAEHPICSSCTMDGLKVSGDTILCKTNTTIITVTRSGNCPIDIDWSIDPAYASITPVNDTTVKLTMLATGNGLLSVKWNSACKIIDRPIKLYYNPIVAPPSLGSDTSICKGDTIQLQLLQTYAHIEWSDHSTGVSMPAWQQGQHWVKVSTDGICYVTDTMQIMALHPLPVINIHRQTKVCLPDELILDPGVFASYSWQDASTAPTYEVSAAGKYWVQVTDNNHCKGSDTVMVTGIYDRPTAVAAFIDTAACLGQRIDLRTIRSFVSYNWADGKSSQPVYTVTSPGQYVINVEDENGCPGTDTIVVANKHCKTMVVLPNAFAPHGVNKYFRTVYPGSVPEKFQLYVFNRWGERIFATTDPYGFWDGSIGGYSQTGTFVWQCVYTFPGQPAQKQQGTVTILR